MIGCDAEQLALPGRIGIVEFVQGLAAGDPVSWIALGAIVGCVAFFAVYKRVTGEDFVKSKAERRAARRRRKHVLWEYRGDD